MRIHCNPVAYSLWENQELITLLRHQFQSLMMGLNLIIYVSHSSVDPTQSLNNICPGNLMSKARAGNHPNVILLCTQVDHKIPMILWMIPPAYVTRTVRMRTQFCKSQHIWYLWQLKYLWLQKLYKKTDKNFEASDSNTISKPSQRG